MPEIFPYNGEAPPNGCLMERAKYDANNNGIVDFAEFAYNLAPGSAAAVTAVSSSIANGVEDHTIVFPTAFASVPVITGTISRPSGEDLIFANIDSDSVTTTGFSISLSSTTGSANYVFNYIAKIP